MRMEKLPAHIKSSLQLICRYNCRWPLRRSHFQIHSYIQWYKNFIFWEKIQFFVFCFFKVEWTHCQYYGLYSMMKICSKYVLLLLVKVYFKWYLNKLPDKYLSHFMCMKLNIMNMSLYQNIKLLIEL